MDGFKNPFDELEDDQMINISETNEPTHETSKKTNKQSYARVEENTLDEESTIDLAGPKQTSSISNTNYDGEDTIFMRQGDSFGSRSTVFNDEEPPLLEDIGIDLGLVLDKINCILKFEKPLHRYIEEPDLFGPIAIGFIFGFLLLLSNKIHFGDIYALFVIGNILVFLLFNLMSQNQTISLYNIMSTLGYCLLPMLIVGAFGILFSLKNAFGIILSMGLSVWSAYCASSFIEMELNVDDRRALILYPLYLYYVSFAMITIF